MTMQIEPGLIRKLRSYFIPLPANMGAHVIRVSNQAIANNLWVQVRNFSVPAAAPFYNTAGHWAAGTPDVLTCIRAGQHQVSGCIQFAANATGDRGLAITINGLFSVVRELIRASSALETEISISKSVWLEAGDALSLHAFQTSGAPLNAQYTTNLSPTFSIARIP